MRAGLELWNLMTSLHQDTQLWVIMRQLGSLVNTSGFYFSDIFCGFVFKINKQCRMFQVQRTPVLVCCSGDSASWCLFRIIYIGSVCLVHWVPWKDLKLWSQSSTDLSTYVTAKPDHILTMTIGQTDYPTLDRGCIPSSGLIGEEGTSWEASFLSALETVLRIVYTEASDAFEQQRELSIQSELSEAIPQ